MRIEDSPEEIIELESIGTVLRNERTNRGISLAEAHEATKITVQNLDALEQDRFESFPNRVYARAFLRDYANYLGLDSNALLDRYESEWGPKAALEVPKSRSRVAYLWAVLALIALAAIAVGAASLLLPGAPEKPASQTAKKEQKPAPKPKPEATPAPKPVATAETPATTPVPAPVTELKLQLSATQAAWVRVKADGQAPSEFTMKPGEVRSFTAKDKFTVRLGAPENVQVHLNGQRLEQFGPGGIPVTKELDRSLLKPQAPAAGEGNNKPATSDPVANSPVQPSSGGSQPAAGPANNPQ